MTNQAAQTMPELPEPWTIRYHDDATGREIGPPTPLYTAAQMHQYARDYAAALAAPQQERPHPDALPDGTLSKSTTKRVEALAASGGEGRLTRAEAITEFRSRTAASVSERARALLAAEYRAAGFNAAADWIAEADMDAEENDLDRCVIRALEQALTQQRGEDVESAARALFEAQADRLAAPWDRQWEPTKEHWRKVARWNLYATTPSPAQTRRGSW